MSERVFKDTRLLEALEFIDDEYIASAARYKMKYEAQPAEPPKMTWRTPFKHWRHIAALAACILLLSIASPLVSYIAEVIRDINAGAGSSLENTSELLTEPETTNGMYDKYILTEEDLAKLNEAEFIRSVVKDPNYADKDEAFFDELREKLKDTQFHKFALSVEQAMERSTVPGDTFYFGKYGDCIVVAKNTGAQTGWSPSLLRKYILGEYFFSYAQSIMLACYNSEFYDVKKAYEMGLITDFDVKIMYELYREYYSVVIFPEYLSDEELGLLLASLSDEELEAFLASLPEDQLARVTAILLSVNDDELLTE
jgi:hypothetical protein